jgi:hypothetical protein
LVNDAHLALLRATKMTFLFKEPVFGGVMAALNMPSGTPGREQAFRGACQGLVAQGKLTDSEINWLWNYLKECHELGADGWKGVPEAAQTGW